MISKVEIENFKSFEKASVELRKFNVLIGPNNSGKSNFCAAFKLVHEMAIQPGFEVFFDKLRVSQLARLEGKNIKLSFRIQENGTFYSYAAQLREESPFLIRETINENTPDSITRELGQKVKMKDKEVIFPSLSPNDSILFHKAMAKNVKPLMVTAKVFTSTYFYRFIPGSIHTPAFFKKDTPIRIEESGFGLPAVLDHLLRKNRSSFDNIENKITNKFKDIKEIILNKMDIPEQNTIYEGHVIAFKLKGREEPIESHHISDGISYFLLFLTLMHLPDKPSIIFIEEPENGIHPSNLKEIIGHIRELGEENNCQVIITTHSPYLLDFVKTEEVLIFYRKEDGPTQVRRMEDVPNVREKLKYFMLGELWTEKGEKGLIEEIENAKD